MNGAHLHLVLNHLPVVGIGFGLALLIFALVKKSPELQKVSLGVLVITALLTLPAYFTGEPAEELVEDVAGISEAIVERHEDAAKVALIASGILGAVALGGLILFRRAGRLPTGFIILVLALALGAEGTMAWTANLGGQIRHPEIRHALNAPVFNETGYGQDRGWERTDRERDRHDKDDD